MIVLETERLLFRSHALEDREAFCAMEMDADFRRYVGGEPRTREAAEERFQRALRRARDKLGLWATVHKADGAYIGRCGIYPHHLPGGAIPGEGVLAFYLAKPYWGRGLATEAGRAFLRLGPGELGLHRVVASTDADHAASIRVLEKLGFSLERVETGTGRSFRHFELRDPHVAARGARA